jgi:2-polyprenyl-6-methoxyphenol hydroxylase-like FAD-dependent oxidoreductase
MKILIVGAGIGGLSCALALRKFGHEVVIVEKRASFEPVGAGIVLAQNGRGVLEWLGVELANTGRVLASMRVADEHDRTISSIDFGSQAPTRPVAISRAALHHCLLAALQGSTKVHVGVSLTGLEESNEGVVVAWSEASAGEMRLPTEFDLVVGADGIHSQIRRFTNPQVELHYSGTTCYRGLMPNPGISQAAEFWGGAVRAGVVPIEGDQLYYFLVHRVAANEPRLTWPAAFLEQFDRLRHRGDASLLFRHLNHAPPLHHDLFELDRVVWGRARTILIGDAAHALTPNQGQGAGMAIEDALALSLALRNGIAGALPRFVKMRDDRVQKIKRDSARFGRLAHIEVPIARRTLGWVMTRLPKSFAQSQMEAIVGPGRELVDAAIRCSQGR